MAGSESGSGDPARVLLFVYGTLREGERAASMLAGCAKLGENSIRGELHDVNGRYPAVVLRGEGSVEGEIWSCPSKLLRSLDRYEGVDVGLFRRAEVPIDGTRCSIYVAGPQIEPLLSADTRIDSGRWPRTTGS